jgi:hypothetical protein
VGRGELSRSLQLGLTPDRARGVPALARDSRETVYQYLAAARKTGRGIFSVPKKS